MGAPTARFDLVGTLTLQNVRAFLRATQVRVAVVFFGLLYLLIALFGGGMVTLAPIGGPYQLIVVLASGTGQGWWNYPGMILIAPWGVVVLPFFPTIAMAVVTIGVALGMAVAAGLVIRLIFPIANSSRPTSLVGTVTGLTPAMISLVTLGACCSTTAVATAGIGLVAAASGTSVANLLLNNWYLGVFQILIVWIALLGQELLLTVYGGLFGLPNRLGAASARSPPKFTRRSLVGGVARAALIVGGVLWSLTMLVEWTVVSPLAAPAGWWVRWGVQHQLVAALAVSAGFFPAGTYRFLARCRASYSRLFPALLLLAGASLLVWLPPPLPAWGLDSVANQVLGVAGVPAGWGGVVPSGSVGLELAVRWGLEYGLLGAFSILAAVRPDWAFAPLFWTVGKSSEPDSTSSRSALSGTVPAAAILTGIGPRPISNPDGPASTTSAISEG